MDRGLLPEGTPRERALGSLKCKDGTNSTKKDSHCYFRGTRRAQPPATSRNGAGGHSSANEGVKTQSDMFRPIAVRDEPVECLPWAPRTGVCQCFPCFGNVRAHSGRRWPRPREFKFASFSEFQVGLCPYVTAAVKAASHIGMAYVAAAAEVCSRFIGTCRDLGCTHSVYIQTRQVFLGRCNEVWHHRFRSPPFGSPFHPFPFTYFCFLFSFMSSCLHVWSSHPFLRLRAHWSRP